MQSSASKPLRNIKKFIRIENEQPQIESTQYPRYRYNYEIWTSVLHVTSDA